MRHPARSLDATKEQPVFHGKDAQGDPKCDSGLSTCDITATAHKKEPETAKTDERRLAEHPRPHERDCAEHHGEADHGRTDAYLGRRQHGKHL